MKRAIFIRLLTLVLVSLLLYPSWVSTADANSVSSSGAVKPISTLRAGNVTFELVDLNMIPSGSSQIVAFSIVYHNQSGTPLPLIDYWVRLASKSGSQFDIKISAQDKDADLVAPNSKKVITYYSKVSSSVKITDLVIRMIQWDFNSANYERSLGQFTIPAQYDDAVKAQGTKTYYISDVLMQAKVTSASLSKSDSNHIVNLNFQLTNVGNTSVALPKYQFYVLTSNGIMYPLETMDMKDNEQLFPLIPKQISLRGQVPLSIDSKGWQLVLTVHDEMVQGSVPVASFYLPTFTAGETITVEYGKTKDLTVDNMKVRTKVERFTRSKNDANYVGTVTFSFENLGNNPVTLPKYEYGIRTGDGLTYPITVDAGDISINPRVKKEIKLTVTVPSSVSDKDWSLVLFSPRSEGGAPLSGVTLAMYMLPDTAAKELTVGSTFEYVNEDGKYVFKLDSVQRYPWEDQDILTANVSITNPGGPSKPVPTIEGVFVLDNTVEIPFKAILRDQIIAIKGLSSAQYILYGMIPYTYDYSSLKIKLKEKTGQDSSVEIVEYVTDSRIEPLNSIPLSGKHKIQGTGRNSEVSVRSVRLYQNSEETLYTVLLNAKNLEKRYNKLAGLVGYLKTKDDMMYPVTFTKLEDKIAPQGIVTLMLWSRLPATVDTEGMELILGEAVSNNELISDGTPDAYINATSFKLPEDDATPSSSFDNLVFYPYTLQIQNIKAEPVTTERVNFRFDYSLSKSPYVTGNMENHQVYLEFRDTSTNFAFSKTLTLNQGEGDSNLKLGSNLQINFSIDDSLLVHRLPYMKDFTLKVYDEFMGHRKLIAENKLSWFFTNP
jgi:hypothetical protein